MRVFVLVVLDPEKEVLSIRAFAIHEKAVEEFEKAMKAASSIHLVRLQVCDLETNDGTQGEGAVPTD